MYKLKEAAEAAEDLSTEELKLDLHIRPGGVMARARIGMLESYWLVSWQEINQSNNNPLLAALHVTAETVRGKYDG